jgi:hypothetical protein
MLISTVERDLYYRDSEIDRDEAREWCLTECSEASYEHDRCRVLDPRSKNCRKRYD